ncbi:GNAT family N-acetyltransferase [Streptomyces tanashiensis]|uniref:GNAT family N-acetyltransferase n=1 Tax=Streptomyces tanashiensis TaxID=67367 RepID=A0ABY6QSQ7_9ACTN|nr:GNAT family N-acetyltransferase [Streptomyces tanashiensis]UZX20720.1 GNAT family N-acetyltransferase [Streptomyces tanashiensis]GGY36805.1 N-acetyltransferase [Streptomyces tanashiensis]
MPIREALPEDAAALAAVHVLSWRAAYRDLVPAAYLDALDVEERAAVWHARLTAPDRAAVLVATDDDGRVVAFSCFRAWPDEEFAAGSTAELAALYALPEVWGTGVGRVLLSASTEALVADGFRAAALWVFAGNGRGRRFYEAAGWRPDGTAVREETGGRVLEELRYRRDLFA